MKCRLQSLTLKLVKLRPSLRHSVYNLVPGQFDVRNRPLLPRSASSLDDPHPGRIWYDTFMVEELMALTDYILWLCLLRRSCEKRRELLDWLFKREEFGALPTIERDLNEKAIEVGQRRETQVRMAGELSRESPNTLLYIVSPD